LKMIFEMKKELFYKSAIKGILAEDEIADFLNQYFSDKKLSFHMTDVGTNFVPNIY